MNTTIDDLYIESKCYFEVKKKLDDTQKELIDLQIENKQLKERVKELENNTTTMIYNTDNIQHTMCCAFHVENIFNFCPNCGRKIIRR